MTPSGPPTSPQNHDFPRPASTGRRQFPRNASHSDDKPRPAHLNFRYLTTYTNRGNVLVATNHSRHATGPNSPRTFARRCTARALHTPPRRDVTAAPRPSPVTDEPAGKLQNCAQSARVQSKAKPPITPGKRARQHTQNSTSRFRRAPPNQTHKSIQQPQLRKKPMTA